MKPLVTVLMPVYNAEKFLAEAIESILAQTYRNFEFLIINDGSTDSSLSIIEKYSKQDKRIRVVSRANKGLVRTLNEGLKLAKTAYLARMDADDVALKQRLEKQIKYLEANPDCVVVGASFESIREDGSSLGRHYCFINDATIRHALPLEGCIPHPTAMYRLQTVLGIGGYDNNYFPAEDYDLWRRLAYAGRLQNLETPLLKYRLSGASISGKNKGRQQAAADKIRSEEWARRSDNDLKVTIKQLSLPGEYLPAIVSLQKRLAAEARRRKRLGLYRFLKMDAIKYRLKI
jgi:hypothetical protein